MATNAGAGDSQTRFKRNFLRRWCSSDAKPADIENAAAMAVQQSWRKRMEHMHFKGLMQAKQCRLELEIIRTGVQVKCAACESAGDISEDAKWRNQKKAWKDADELLFKGMARVQIYDRGDNWNERWQEALSLPNESAMDKGRRRSSLVAVYSDFVHTAVTYGRTIISEYFLHEYMKSVRLKELGGIAGGKKYIWRGILFKLADGSQGPYGGSDEAAAKAAGHELRGASEYLMTGVGLCVPPMCVLDYKGFRMLVQAHVPIGAKTLKMGSSDGGSTVLNDCPDLDRRAAQAASVLGLRAHIVGGKQAWERYTDGATGSVYRRKTNVGGRVLHAAADVEGHTGNDSRMYLLDLARAFPPEDPDATPHLSGMLSVPAEVLVRKKRQTRRKAHAMVTKAHTTLVHYDILYPDGTIEEAVPVGMLRDTRLSIFYRLLRPEYVRDRGRTVLDRVDLPRDQKFPTMKVTNPIMSAIASSGSSVGDDSSSASRPRDREANANTTSGVAVVSETRPDDTGDDGCSGRQAGEGFPRGEITQEQQQGADGTAHEACKLKAMQFDTSFVSTEGKYFEGFEKAEMEEDEQEIRLRGGIGYRLYREGRKSSIGDRKELMANDLGESARPVIVPPTTDENPDSTSSLEDSSVGRGQLCGAGAAPATSSPEQTWSRETPRYIRRRDGKSNLGAEKEIRPCSQEATGYGPVLSSAFSQPPPPTSMPPVYPPPQARLEPQPMLTAVERRMTTNGFPYGDGRPVPLSPDALTAFSEGDPQSREINRDVTKATQFLLTVVVPATAKFLCSMPPSRLSVINLAQELHKYGVNMRHIGLLRAYVTPASTENTAARETSAGIMRDRALVEVVVRTLKLVLRGFQRRWMKSNQSSSEHGMHLLVTQFLNAVTGQHQRSDLFWREQVTTGVCQRFGIVALTETERAGLRAVFSDRPELLLAIVKELVKATGVRFVEGVDQKLRMETAASIIVGFKFDVTDIRDIEAVVTPMAAFQHLQQISGGPGGDDQEVKTSSISPVKNEAAKVGSDHCTQRSSGTPSTSGSTSGSSRRGEGKHQEPDATTSSHGGGDNFSRLDTKEKSRSGFPPWQAPVRTNTREPGREKTFTTSSPTTQFTRSTEDRARRHRRSTEEPPTQPATSLPPSEAVVPNARSDGLEPVPHSPRGWRPPMPQPLQKTPRSVRWKKSETATTGTVFEEAEAEEVVVAGDRYDRFSDDMMNPQSSQDPRWFAASNQGVAAAEASAATFRPDAFPGEIPTSGCYDHFTAASLPVSSLSTFAGAAPPSYQQHTHQMQPPPNICSAEAAGALGSAVSKATEGILEGFQKLSPICASSGGGGGGDVTNLVVKGNAAAGKLVDVGHPLLKEPTTDADETLRSKLSEEDWERPAKSPDRSSLPSKRCREGLDDGPTPRESTCMKRRDFLATSLGPSPATYVSDAHGVEFELQDGSLDEELPLEMAITQGITFVDCRTDRSGRAPFCEEASTQEFLAMTFIHGPEGVTFPRDKPAKLRFFLGYVDEFSPAEDGSNQAVVITDEEIERDVLQMYKPLTSPDGVEDWTILGQYSVVFRRLSGKREVWVETPVYHFSVTANAMKIDQGARNQSYYYGDLGGLRWWFKGRSSAPRVRFGNTTEELCAAFTYYPIVQHTEAALEREWHAQIGAVDAAVGGGNRSHDAARGDALPAAAEKITTLVEVRTYEDCDLSYDVKQHLQMHVRVGVLLELTKGLCARGKLQLLDVRKISGSKILVLRQPRLRKPTQYEQIDWPCSAEDICRELKYSTGPHLMTRQLKG